MTNDTKLIFEAYQTATQDGVETKQLNLCPCCNSPGHREKPFGDWNCRTAHCDVRTFRTRTNV